MLPKQLKTDKKTNVCPLSMDGAQLSQRFTTQFPGVPGTHLINLEGWEAGLTLEPPSNSELWAPRVLLTGNGVGTTRADKSTIRASQDF